MDYVGFDCKRTVPLQSFLALSHSSSHARASALTSPPPDFLFISIHQTPPSHKFPPFHPKQKEQSLLVLPSVHTILNFATEFFEMFTKLQSEHPQKVFQVFQVFRVFQVFHFAFGPQNRSVLVQIRTKPKKPIPTHLRHVMATENTQKGNSPTCLRTRYCMCYRRIFFRRSRLFSISIHPKPPSLQTSPNQVAAIKNSRK